MNRLHQFAPREWRRTPDVTGSFELDASIERCTNKDLPKRMQFYVERDNAYGPKTGYDGYHGYSGDD